ncbi:glycosyltransferase family A protein [Neorhodopirellula lusitana]|uniref:glycosyltransferase family A protein n=1 Tax=Neorhodopirellula lusitana TaxID=445327 RepID=UPI00384A735C
MPIAPHQAVKPVATSLSVVVCCYQSEKVIEDTVEAIARQDLDQHINWELLLIDNNCQDATVRSAEEVWAANGSPTAMRVVQELNQGLTAARKRGVEESQFNTIVFCDDDNLLASNYLQICFDLFSASPRLGVVGGTGTLARTEEHPSWSDECSRYLAFFPTDGLPEEHFTASLYGAGMAIRRTIAIAILNSRAGNILMDRTGKDLSSGGDTVMAAITSIIGWDALLTPELRFVHAIPPSRFEPKYLRRLRYAMGKSGVELLPLILLRDNKVHHLKSYWPTQVLVTLVRLVLQPWRNRSNKSEVNLELWGLLGALRALLKPRAFNRLARGYSDEIESIASYAGPPESRAAPRS